MHDQCIEKTGSQRCSKKCSNLMFSRQCGFQLLKEVVSASGSVKLYPHKVYCFHSLIHSFQKLLLRPGFIDLCETTRSLYSKDNFMEDVYQGNIWKEFLKYNGEDFLIKPHNYALILNVDWFQPFEHFTYSVGVIYLAILNLPRSVRYK